MSTASSNYTPEETIARLVSHVSHLLPSQGPIEVFIHHNTLHSFEDMHFIEGVEAAAKLYGARPYMPEQFYQESYKRERILPRDLEMVLPPSEDDSVIIANNYTIRDLRTDALIFAVSSSKKEAVWWQLLERDGFSRWNDSGRSPELLRALASRDLSWAQSEMKAGNILTQFMEIKERLPGSRNFVDSLYQDIKALLAEGPSIELSLRLLWVQVLSAILQNEDILSLDKDLSGEEQPSNSVSELVSPFLVKFTAAFLDQGISRWPLAHREEGFFAALIHHIAHSSLVSPWWLRKLSANDQRFLLSITPERFIYDEFQRMQLPREDWEHFIQNELLELKGWAGMMALFESHRELQPEEQQSHYHSLSGYLAAKLLLEREAERSLRGFSDLRASIKRVHLSWEDIVSNHAFHLFRIVQHRDVAASDFGLLTRSQMRKVVQSLMLDSRLSRQRTWHQAYERRLVEETATALKVHQVRQSRRESHPHKLIQAVFCIDDREESLRRYLEEIDPRIQTFGTAGFFAIDAEYQPHGGNPAPFCPISVVPTHRVVEHKGKRAGQRLFDVLPHIQRALAHSSQRSFHGWLVSLGGSLAFLPMLLKTVAPRSLQQTQKFLDWVLPDSKSVIDYESLESALSTSKEDGVGVSMITGFSVREMVDRVYSLLTTIGLTEDFSPLVVLVGHGSLSRNNPYKSAYDCGACGGRPAQMNSRVFALMANRIDVREKLRERGIAIPESTLFIGGFHNTCDDSLSFFERDKILDTHWSAFEDLLALCDKARAYNALERCRRFEGVEVTTPDEALLHVEERTYHIAEPRPEYGHATNALCIVGRREVTKHLFLDRRAFLTSYDYRKDPTGVILSDTLHAVTPVCMGINLEYYFSAVDNEVYGSGTKLPHNIASLLGLMTGYSSDLRTGLPQQMIEIHEPVRLILMIESSRRVVTSVLAYSQRLTQIFANEWVIPCVFESADNRVYRLVSGRVWEEIGLDDDFLPHVGTSRDWIHGRRECLSFASIAARQTVARIE
jgi:uncharacterized protein